MQYEMITRKAALEQGRVRFYTGRPCSKGHDAQRFVTTGGCVECNRQRSREFSKVVKATQSARTRGLFTYPLRPEDYAAALAYCQALDMNAGLMPHIPDAKKPPDAALPFALPDDIARHRKALIEAHSPKSSTDNLPIL